MRPCASPLVLQVLWLVLCALLRPAWVKGCDLSVTEVSDFLEVDVNTNLPCNLTSGEMFIDIGIEGIANVDTSGVRYVRILSISGAGTQRTRSSTPRTYFFLFVFCCAYPSKPLFRFHSPRMGRPP